MTTVTDLMPFAGTISGGFFVGLLAGYAIIKSNQDCSRNRRMFIAALAYLEYQRIIQVDWLQFKRFHKMELQWLANAITHISNNIGADHGSINKSGII